MLRRRESSAAAFFIARPGGTQGERKTISEPGANLLAESFSAHPNQILWLAIDWMVAIAAIDQHPLE
jgi:hypothetical protein